MKDFDGVVGQPEAVAALSSHLARTNGAGATLIVGPEGVGRFLLARRAAQAILGPAVRSDLYIVDPEEGIDGIRSVIARLMRKPLEGPRSVLILRDVDRFSIAAHNALLKTLEEPPADAAIFLVAEADAFLPETVVSRCRLIRTRPLSDEQCRAVADVDEAADAEGSPGRALYHAEQEVAEDATALVSCLRRETGDPLAASDKLARKRPGEDSKVHRRRVIETLRVAAARLRRELPESEESLRELVSALGSLRANANPAIVLADLVLYPWKNSPKANAT